MSDFYMQRHSSSLCVNAATKTRADNGLMQNESTCVQATAPQTITASAEKAWRDNPHLAFVFHDFGAFLQANLQTRREHFEQLSESESSNAGTQERERLLALARLGLIKNAQGTGEKPTAIERQGARLILWIYGPIGEPGLVAKDIVGALEDHSDAKGIVLRIASAGGYLDESQLIAEAIMRHKGKSLAIVDRYALSGGSAITSAANRVLIRRNSTWMAHAPWITCQGDADRLQSKAGELRTSTNGLAGLYFRRRRISHADALALIRSGRYLSAEDAVAVGVADQVIHELPIEWDNINGNEQ